MSRTTVTILRNSIAPPTSPNQSYSNRKLGAEGVRLAKLRREMLGDPQFELVFHTPILSTNQTAREVNNLVLGVKIVEVPELWHNNQSRWVGETFDNAWKAVGGNKSVEEYFNLDHKVAIACKAYAYTAWANLLDRGILEHEGSALVISHAVLTPLIALAATEKSSVDNWLLTITVFKECEGVVLIFENGVVTNFKLITD